jgi:chromosomal replication initiator protein
MPKPSPVLEATMSDLWEDVKKEIRGSLPEKTFSLWISPISLLERKDDVLVLGCPNRFSMNWIHENYMPMIQDRLAQMGNGHCTLTFKVNGSAKPTSPPSIFAAPQQLCLPNVPVRRRALNQGFTFDRFVVGKCNEFAYSASKALALESDISWRSLFILSNTGLGKSHLSQAAAHAIMEKNPNLRVIYLTAEDFVNEMILALKSNRIEEFKNKFRRQCDVLLLEEVHFLSGKEKTQLELGYTLDALANDDKRIIYTSSFLPQNIPNLAKELSSRLTSGLITTIDKPDYATRIKILERKASEQGMRLSEDIVHLLARELANDIRQMESSLRCLKAKSELLKAEINIDLAREVLQCHSSDGNCVTAEEVKNLVCQYFKVRPEILESKSRKKVHSYPRNIYVYLCRNHTDMTAEDIGRSLNRNHSTVLYASEVIEHKMKVDKKLRNQVEFLSRKLKELTNDRP